MAKSMVALYLFLTPLFGETLDKRLSIHTLVREDIFAGILTNDLDRLTQGEKNVDLLLSERPDAKASLLAWKGSIALYRAVTAHEKHREAESDNQYQRAAELFSEAKRLDDPRGLGGLIVSGAASLLLADRLPERHRAASYATAYEAYNTMWKAQGATVDKMPLHLKGELLAGLAQSAQRTGHADESAMYLERMIALLPGTPYESRAKAWKTRPEIAGRTALSCQTCHEEGRLAAARTAALAK